MKKKLFERVAQKALRRAVTEGVMSSSSEDSWALDNPKEHRKAPWIEEFQDLRAEEDAMEYIGYSASGLRAVYVNVDGYIEKYDARKYGADYVGSFTAHVIGDVYYNYVAVKDKIIEL